MTAGAAAYVDRVTDAFFALDTDFRFTYLNEQAATLLESSTRELIGRVVWDEFPRAVETQFPNGFYRAMDEQVPVTFEVYHSRLESWFEVRAYPSETGLSVYLLDITERKTQETTAAQHAAVIEAIDDGVVTLDRNRRIVAVNGAMAAHLDADRDELVGEHVEVVTELAGIDDEDAIAIGRGITDVDAGNAEQRRLEIQFTDSDGTNRVGELRIVPIQDETATVATVVRDITDRREYERIVTSLHEVTRWLLDSDDPEEICAIAVHAGSDLLDLPISGVWLLEEERGYLEPIAGTAGAYEEFGGLPRFNPGEGLVWDVFESGEVERFDDLENVDDLYNPDTPIQSEIIAPIGTHGVLMTGSFEPYQFDETDVDLLSTLVENTRAALDRADRERVLRRRTKQLEQQTKRLESIADVLSTDLNHHLETIADALEDDGDTDWEFPLAADSVEATLDRTEHLVDDVREFARNASDVGTRTRIDLADAIETALESSQLEEDAVVFDEQATLRADSERFRHLLESAFDNVAARAGDDDVTVRIELCGFESDDRSRGFCVFDDAAAIATDGREGAVGPTVDDETAIDGLGLAVVRAIAQAHDWTPAIENGEHERTRIEIRDVTTLERQEE
ncbi:histidine kinase [Natronococcus pandeyae]|uniref:histidine kinase n=1 Tax=Natronococcus pandeyae TaxID=2055836 RepID=A0A8J8Q094_9EURY|nr:PAS domain-containing protein [Natronococcus pandeyae]TYL37051.1 histidine kinase [Natronococcus pandeyae]